MGRFSLIAISTCALLLSNSACSDAPAAGDCKKLLNHMIGLQVKNAKEADKAKQTKMLLDDVGPSFLKRCQKNIKGSQTRCGLKATSMAEFEKCDT